MTSVVASATVNSRSANPPDDVELRARRHPISRRYLLPLVRLTAKLISSSNVRPLHFTLANLLLSLAAALLVAFLPGTLLMASLLVWAAWICDRLDGELARQQNACSPFGAWLDANVDELADLALHAGIALALAQSTGSNWPWIALASFCGGKHLFLYSLSQEAPHAKGSEANPHSSAPASPLHKLYHLPANADVRVHLLIFALATGWLAAELLLVAAYYNFRWIARYYLVAQRLRGGAA